jgi:hypothetical protein
VRDPVGAGEEENRGEDDGEEGDGVEKVRHDGRTGWISQVLRGMAYGVVCDDRVEIKAQ